MMFAEEISEDRRAHRVYHDRTVNGVPTRSRKSEKVVWQQGEDRIIVVTAYSPKVERKRAAEIGRVANQEMQYDFGVYNENEPPDDREIHLFIYCSGNRAVGLSILERRTGVCHFTWEEFENHVQKTIEEQDAIWSLGFTWVHKKCRRRGIAKILLMMAASYLVVQIEDIGLYSPFSSDGKAFARSIFREGFLIAK